VIMRGNKMFPDNDDKSQKERQVFYGGGRAGRDCGFAASVKKNETREPVGETPVSEGATKGQWGREAKKQPLKEEGVKRKRGRRMTEDPYLGGFRVAKQEKGGKRGIRKIDA